MIQVSRFGRAATVYFSFACFILCSTHLFLAQDQEWNKKFLARLDELTKKNGEGVNKGLQAELLNMAVTDQDIRKRRFAAPADQKQSLELEEARIDHDLTYKLEGIVARNGWPTIAMVGVKGSQAAALILIHSEDHAFQRIMLPSLQDMVEKDEIVGGDIALITDKILIADGKPQRFGSQFRERDGKWVMLPVEDPEHLEQRRAKYMLPPIAQYKKVLADMYHMPVE